MRYVSAAYLKEGMVLARPVYGAGLNMLLTGGMALGTAQIARIIDLKYSGVYVNDSISDGIEAQDVIPDKLRINTIKAARELIGQAENGAMQKPGIKVSGDTQRRIVMPVINALIASRGRLIEMIDLRPAADYSYYHAANVVVLSLLMGLELGVSGNQLYELGMAALLHDVGNIFIPASILQKPSSLSSEEYDVIKRHTEMGFEFLRAHFDISIDACLGALQHHENYDGSGYPGQLQKDKISIYGRIIAVADVYDALVSLRPFRQPMLPPEAIDFMRYQSGAMFDPQIVEALRRMVSIYPTGAIVELSSGVRCIVTGNNPGDPERPCLRLLDSISKTPMQIDLQNDARFASLKVSRLVDI